MLPSGLDDADAASGLDDTGIFDGDTNPVVPIEVAPTEVAPVDAVEVSPPEPPSRDASAPSNAVPNAHVQMTLRSSGAIRSEKSLATLAPPSVPSPHVMPPRALPKKVVEPAATLTAPSKQSAAKPKGMAKPDGKAASKIERSSKGSRSTGLRRALPIAGLIGLVGLVAGGAFFLRGSGAATPYMAPQSYALFSPKSFEMTLSCEVPEDWKQRFRGGKNIGPMWAGFTDGRLSVEISENLSGGAIREAVVAMRKKAAPARRDAPAVEQIHEYLSAKSHPRASKRTTRRRDLGASRRKGTARQQFPISPRRREFLARRSGAAARRFSISPIN